MGGSASLVAIPKGIINETDVPECMLGINSNSSFPSRSYEPSYSASASFQPNYGKSKASTLLDLPANVRVFLESIGIDTDDSYSTDEAIRALRQEERTKK
jgi:hypothetical protein